MSATNSPDGARLSLVWFALALLFFACVLWWKWDRIFEDGSPRPPQPAAFQPIRSTDPNAPKVVVRVVADKTGQPLAGARVVVLNRNGEVLADELTSATGTVEARPTAADYRGVAAFHEDYMIQAALRADGPTELRLGELRFVQVEFGDVSPARATWFRVGNAGITLKAEGASANPIAAKEPFLAFKTAEYVGVRNKVWPAFENPARIPRYLPFRTRIRLVSDPKLPNHLDLRGMRDLKPPKSLAPRRVESAPAIIDQKTFTATLVAPPSTRHGLIARYRRQPGEVGTMMLHLRQLERTEGAPAFGDSITKHTDFAIYEEQDGVGTFSVFGLEDTDVYPTVLIFAPQGGRKTIRCNPIAVNGLTTADLSPLVYGELTIQLPPGEAELVFLDDRMEPMISPGEVKREGNTLHLTRVEPITHRLTLRTATHASPVYTIRVEPGQHAKLEVALQPACKVTMVMNLDAIPYAIRIRDKATGHEHEYRKSVFPRQFKTDRDRANNLVRMTGYRHELFLPHGDYEFVRIDKNGNAGKVIPVTLTGKTMEVSVD